MGRKGSMIEREINSNYLNETMTLKLYQPEAFSPLYKYNICIMQDGNDYFQMGRIATLSDRMHDSEEISNTVFVGIHYQDRYDRKKKYHPSGEQQEAYIKFLVNEVVPLLDEELPTYHMGKSRALMGDSLAGTLALMTALRYPNTFGKVIMQSPYVDEQVLEAVENAKDIHSIDMYHTIGTAETTVDTTDGDEQDFLTPNRKLNDLLEAKEVNYIYHELEEGQHTWKYWQKDMKRVLASMFA
ncbi:enterochelin esterase-like enzyme [Virgibacillus natechei]|uniref:Enterochelin esterase-like enzyme n=1 Tax=Virgibacillus natechei TaxID=1216297 RepID=A0ABS4IDP5_9BACI|nr:alpha/beta hydrolase-fold protein [Virgibacillus natechei]MBP1969062.1 enterochelin esterase-like enzyme [Virgibacillus natechei]UZD14332.1 alpha/beta hydrolase-fold protein [Virgibacillus natechei]